MRKPRTGAQERRTVESPDETVESGTKDEISSPLYLQFAGGVYRSRLILIRLQIACQRRWLNRNRPQNRYAHQWPQRNLPGMNRSFHLRRTRHRGTLQRKSTTSKRPLRSGAKRYRTCMSAGRAILLAWSPGLYCGGFGSRNRSNLTRCLRRPAWVASYPTFAPGPASMTHYHYYSVGRSASSASRRS